VRLEFTHHGPIVSEDSSRGRAFAIRGVHAEAGPRRISLRSRWTRARLAKLFARRWHGGACEREMIYADVDGHIGWVAAVSLPVRPVVGAPSGAGRRLVRVDRFLGIRPLPQAYDLRRFHRHRQTTTSCRPAIRGRSRTSGRHVTASTAFARCSERGALHRRRLRKLQHDDLNLLRKALVPRS